MDKMKLARMGKTRIHVRQVRILEDVLGSFRFFSIFAIIVAIFFAGCRSGARIPQDTLVVGVESASPDSANISQLLHNGLFHLSERMEIEPDLAEGYEFLPPKTYKIRLRGGVLFHNGRELTAEDVKATLGSGLPPQIAEKVESIKVVRPLDLEIVLKESFAPFLSALTIGIVPAGGDPFVGTGPFHLERFEPGKEVVLGKFDRYFGKQKPKIARIRFRILPDDNLRIMEVKNGRIDFLQNSVSPRGIPSLKDNPMLAIETTAGMNMTYLGLNLRRGPLANTNVREAIALALDLPALIDYLMAGLARPGAGVLSPIHWAHEGEVMTYLYDPARARQLLDRAGYPDPDGNGPGQRMTLVYKTSTKRDRIGLARLIARQLREVGIEVKVMPRDEVSFFNDLARGDFELYSLTSPGAADLDISEWTKRGGYENPAIDLLTADARVEMDRQKRKEIYSMIQKVLSQDIPVIPLWYEDNYAVFSRQLKGVQIRPSGSFEWATEIYQEIQ